VNPRDAAITIPISRLVDNPYDPCPLRGHAPVHEIGESISIVGLQQPLLVADGAILDLPGFVIVDGHTRRDAIRLLGHPDVRCLIASDVTTRQHLFERAFALNEMRRREVGAINRAISWSKALKDELYYSISDLARGLQINIEAAKRTLALLRLPDELIQLMRNDPVRIGLSVGTALVEFNEKFGEAETIKYGRRIFESKYSYTADQIRRATALCRSHVPEISYLATSWSFNVKEGGEGRLKTYTNRVVLDVTVLDDARRMQLSAILAKWIDDNRSRSEAD
jgi:ParB/RepB/Spo0J family partition protein